MSLDNFFKSLQSSPLGTVVSESLWMFPTFESIHVLALTLVVGMIAIVDLRLLGAASRNRSVMQLTSEVLPWTWAAFAVAVITGGLMFISRAYDYYVNVPFRVKMVLLVLAGLNMLYFHLITQKGVEKWDMGDTPRAAKVAGLLSLTFWIGVIVFGRWIGFTL